MFGVLRVAALRRLVAPRRVRGRRLRLDARRAAATWPSALLKLHEDNAATLTPDPLYARFYYSHPPAVERLAALVAPALGADRTMTDFLAQKCQARTSAMSEHAIRDHLAQMSGWRQADGAIEKTFAFKG